jgi:hypothetical protein
VVVQTNPCQVTRERGSCRHPSCEAEPRMRAALAEKNSVATSTTTQGLLCLWHQCFCDNWGNFRSVMDCFAERMEAAVYTRPCL